MILYLDCYKLKSTFVSKMVSNNDDDDDNELNTYGKHFKANVSQSDARSRIMSQQIPEVWVYTVYLT